MTVKPANGASVSADVEDLLSSVLVNRNGTRTTLPASRQIFRDGSVALFNGGILEAQTDNGPMSVIVEPGTVRSKEKFRIEPVPLDLRCKVHGKLPRD